ncbi:MAG TPA: methyltransferase domain-containing protein [Candidatus Polarisedimenticolaceae bacterium]|nr:methyltransferase domain-containing protein [Candidatus Polarisedimenticolaceae bacterium]
MSGYIHGTSPEEQHRLTLMNRLANEGSLRELGLSGGERILEMGAGLGEFARAMRRAAGYSGSVVGIEASPEQIARAEALAHAAGEDGRVELRRGDALDPPLRPDEWGSFDVVHARFLLEHLPDPLRAVEVMARAARPGGRVVLEDDDHDLLRLWPEPEGVARVWDAYMESYRRLRCDPLIGRKLPRLLHEAGVPSRRATWIFFGACEGDPMFPVVTANLTGVLRGAAGAIAATGRASTVDVERALEAFTAWSATPGASFGLAIAWAEGVKPAS